MGSKKNSRNVAEFFAGIGLMRMGLELSGWNVVLANDIDPVKQKLYANHFSDSFTHFILGDVHNLPVGTIPDVSLATASFPCTDLSLAGQRAGLKGKHSSAFWGFVNVLNEMNERRPPLVLLENVPGFLTSNGGSDLKDALEALNALGYCVDVFMINAVNFVPQSRIRLFIVGKLYSNTDSPSQLEKINSTEIRPEKLIDFIKTNRQIKWSIKNDLPALPIPQTTLRNIIVQVPKESTLWWNEDRVNYFLKQTFDRHLTKVLELKDRTNYTYLTAFRRIRNNKSMAEIRFDGIAGCLRTPKGGSARQILLRVGKGEIKIRLLTPLECARLMGADEFTISGTLNEALFGFGDAVCVPVVQWIANNYLNPVFNQLSPRLRLKSQNYAAAS